MEICITGIPMNDDNCKNPYLTLFYEVKRNIFYSLERSAIIKPLICNSIAYSPWRGTINTTTL